MTDAWTTGRVGTWGAMTWDEDIRVTPVISGSSDVSGDIN